MNSPPPLSAQRPRPRPPPRIHPAHTHRSNLHHVPPTSAFPRHPNAQPVFLNPYLAPGFIPLPIMPHAIPLAGRAASTTFGFSRPPVSTFPYPAGYAPVHHVHHHHYHHRLSPNSTPEGINHPYNASGRAFPSRQAWERHTSTTSAQSTGNRPQVFDPDGYPMSHDGGDEGPVVVDVDEPERGSAGGMEMVLHRCSAEPRMQYETTEERIDTEGAQGRIDKPSAVIHGDLQASRAVLSTRCLPNATIQEAANRMDVDAIATRSVGSDERDSVHSVSIDSGSTRRRLQGGGFIEQDEALDLSDVETVAEQDAHDQATKSLYERSTAVGPERGVGDQRRTQSLHA